MELSFLLIHPIHGLGLVEDDNFLEIVALTRLGFNYVTHKNIEREC